MERLVKNPFIKINYILEGCLVDYLETHDVFPQVVYLGEKECNKLDKHFCGLVLSFMNMEIVMVMKSSYVAFGDKLESY